MSKEHQENWDERYREEDRWETIEPSNFLIKWEPKLPRGRALVPGCGTGRNAIFLASKGYSVDAIDYSEEGLKIARQRSQKQNVDVNWILSDINQYQFPVEKYHVIMINYFHPQDKLESIKKSLKKEGYFLYEHHIASDDPVDRGPQESRFRYDPNELLEKFSNFHILSYQEGLNISDDGKRSALARIVARKTDAPGKNLLEIEDI